MSDAKPSYHPELQAIAKRLPRVTVRTWTMPLFGVVDFVVGMLSRGGERIDLETTSVWMYRPKTPAPTPGPAVLWIHGGGMIVGDARQDQGHSQALADELGVPVASVQYRLSTHHPYPEGLEDCMEAMEWLAAQDGVDPDMIIVMGASGGGGLAAQLALRATAEARLVPCIQVLIFPMLDDRSSDADHPHEAMYRTWDTASNRIAWDRYLAGHDRDNPPSFAVPGRATSLEGLPPAWIGVGTLDLFHDEDVSYARRLEEAGVPTELVIVEGAFHGFSVFGADQPVSQAFHASQIAAIRARLAELGWTHEPS